MNSKNNNSVLALKHCLYDMHIVLFYKFLEFERFHLVVAEPNLIKGQTLLVLSSTITITHNRLMEKL